MKKIIFILIFAFCNVLNAQINGTLSYQGVLTQMDGTTPIKDGSYSMRFLLFNSPSNSESVWSESQDVLVINGLFNVMLGNNSELKSELFKKQLYLAFTVNSDGKEVFNSNTRMPLSSSPYAFTAKLLETNPALDELKNVQITSAKPGQVVKWNQNSQKWVNEDDLDGIGTGVVSINGQAGQIIIQSGAGIEITQDNTNPNKFIIKNTINEAERIPVGSVMALASDKVPEGWMLCDGRELNRTEYQELFESIGTAHGTSSGSKFNIPDYRGYFLRGLDPGIDRDPDANARGTMNAGGATGRNVGSVQDHSTALPQKNGFAISNTDINLSHDHAFTDYSFSECQGGKGHQGANSTDNDNGPTSNFRHTTEYANINANHYHTISGGDNETRPVNAYVNYIIKVKP